MVLFNVRTTPAVSSKRQTRSKTAAATLAKAARGRPELSAASPAWDTSALPRTIRTRLMARTAKAEPQDKKSSRWALGQWLGDAAASEALAAVQAANKAKQAAVPPKGDDSPCLYMDEEGNAHLGVRPGDDREIFNAMRQLQAQEQQAANQAVERRLPAHIAQRRAAAAASRRAPRVEQPVVSRATKRKAAHMCFQPRRFN